MSYITTDNKFYVILDTENYNYLKAYEALDRFFEDVLNDGFDQQEVDIIKQRYSIVNSKNPSEDKELHKVLANLLDNSGKEELMNRVWGTPLASRWDLDEVSSKPYLDAELSTVERVLNEMDEQYSEKTQSELHTLVFTPDEKGKVAPLHDDGYEYTVSTSDVYYGEYWDYLLDSGEDVKVYLDTEGVLYLYNSDSNTTYTAKVLTKTEYNWVQGRVMDNGTALEYEMQQAVCNKNPYKLAKSKLKQYFN